MIVRTLIRGATCALALSSVCACASTDDPTLTGGGVGANSGSGNGSGGTILSGTGGGNTGGAGGGSEDCGSNLTGALRDFQEAHPDFEYELGVDPGIVQQLLGADGKPVYAGNPTTPTTTGQANFDQWFRDVASVNMTSQLTLNLVDNGNGTFTYDNSSFFPLDGQGWDNEGHPHNYHFTFELRTAFRYNGGEVFTFTGDDDLFVFVNGKLAIDLGGVHGAISGSVDLDANAAFLGIVAGNVYPLDFFFAERHLVESNFRIDTTIDEFVDCGDPVE